MLVTRVHVLSCPVHNTQLAALLYFAIPPAKVKLVAEGGKSTKKTKMLTGIEQLDVDKREQLKNLLAGLGLPLSAMLPLVRHLKCDAFRNDCLLSAVRHRLHD